MKFENGVYATMLSGVLVPRCSNDLVLYGNKAKIICKDTVGIPLKGEFWVEGDNLNMKTPFTYENSPHGLYRNMIESFTKCVLENREPPATGYDGLENVRIANALLDSARSGKKIKIIR
jgi:predicted dehydrogenase